ncbi:MAG: cysteine-rich CWC family protein [Gammaproteobacteria bacterium]|nr:cysteine-rich CWC family protein [Gammaproteobacteria bacterium]
MTTELTPKDLTLSLTEKVIQKTCPICQSPLNCGIEPGKDSCWCDDLPYIMPASFELDCRCKVCLIQAIQLRIEETLKQHAHEDLLAIARPFFKPDKLIEGIDYSIEQGNYVFSQWYHLKRGHCCGNGCRNCPYPS